MLDQDKVVKVLIVYQTFISLVDIFLVFHVLIQKQILNRALIYQERVKLVLVFLNLQKYQMRFSL